MADTWQGIGDLRMKRVDLGDGTFADGVAVPAGFPVPTIAPLASSVIVAVGSRTSFSQAVQTNSGGFKGIILHLNATIAGTGTLRVRLWNRVDAANAYGEGIVIQSTLLSAAGVKLLMAYPGLSVSTPPVGYDAAGPFILGNFYYVDTVHSDASAWTYGIAATFVP